MNASELKKLTDALWMERVLFLGQLPAFETRALLEADVKEQVSANAFSDYHAGIRHYERQLQG